MPSIGNTDISKIRLKEQASTPASPASGYLYVYGKDDGLLYYKNDAGTEYVVGQGLTNPMTTANDLIIGGASGVPARLAKGTDGQVLTVDPTTHNLVWADPTGGGGGGGSTSTGAYSALPAAGNSGNLYLPNDSPYLLRDNGSAWEAWGPVRKLTLPPTSGWSWVNQGTATVTTTSGAILLTAPAAASENWRCYVRTAPATPYTITVLIIPNLVPINFHGCGFIWRESSSGRLHRVGPQYASATSGMPFLQNGTKASATAGNADYAWYPWGTFAPLWLQLSDNGTSRISRFSIDGKNFITLHTVSRTDYLTGGADQVGIAVMSNNTTYDASMLLASWAES